ncbi:MAG: tail fiber protein [Alphaproteobacteria bacterium]|nr:tail fiber protein [Alphaproteobacteria bacterium]
MPDNYFTGQIAQFPYSFAPAGWAECAGQTVPIGQYSDLFSLIGTAYGGDGQRNFGLPDLQGRAALGFGTLPGGGTYGIAQKDGSEYVALTDATMPFHQHLLTAINAQGTTNTPKGNILAQVSGGDLEAPSKGNIYSAGQPNVQLQYLNPAGGSDGQGGPGPTQPHNNMQPSVVLRYCICLTGIMPNAS